MRVFRRASQPSAPPARTGFGEWLLRQFAGGREVQALPYAELERVCANAGSLLVGAAYAAPARFSPGEAPEIAREAALVARRTADGFRASLDDRTNTVLAWPWDHMATAIAWQASRGGEADAAALGAALETVGGAYALRHRDQARAVLDLWQQVAAGVHAGDERPELGRLGAEMLAAYEATTA